MMDAFLHADCGLDNMTRAQYTSQELARLQLGYILRKRPGSGGGDGSPQKRRIERGQRQAREEMLEDLGFQ